MTASVQPWHASPAARTLQRVPAFVSACQDIAQEVRGVLEEVRALMEREQPPEACVKPFGRLITHRKQALARHGFGSLAEFESFAAAALHIPTAREAHAALASCEGEWQQTLDRLDRAARRAGQRLQRGHPAPAFSLPSTARVRRLAGPALAPYSQYEQVDADTDAQAAAADQAGAAGARDADAAEAGAARVSLADVLGSPCVLVFLRHFG